MTMGQNDNDSRVGHGISSLICRGAPEPWAEGDNIPWDEAGFSERMLAEHLSQDHDMASRRASTIDAQVAWIHGELLGGRPARILDLGCGPGLYSSRLAGLGHECLGIDFSPASIRYAKELAAGPRFALGDLREAEYGGPHDLAMQIFGEINVFRPADAALVLGKAAGALAPGGLVLLEAHDFATIERLGREGPSWQASAGGLFSPRPHLLLLERHWDEGRAIATIRYDVVDAANGSVVSFAQSLQAYTEEGYRRLLAGAGFREAEFLPGFGSAPPTPGLSVIVARRTTRLDARFVPLS
jgi:SAM-dependent methyltransferase